MPHAAVIFGTEGLELTPDERAFFQDIKPWGFIVFARNIESPTQLLRLTDELRALDGRADLPILIDQEGGRVARLRPPEWRLSPPAAAFGELYPQDPDRAATAARLNSRLIASELSDVGITVDCVPVLDVPVEDADPIIGDRAYGSEPDQVAQLGRAAADGLLDGGVLPVIKHIPGHGRADLDTHLALPRVTCSRDDLAARDFVPFMALSDLPLAMTAHVVFEAIDGDQPATLSHAVVDTVIRKHIGFDGALMSDDLSMKALEGDFGARTAACYRAGLDLVLHCNGDRAEMEAVASESVPLAGEALRRCNAALDRLRPPQPFDRQSAEEELSSLLNAPPIS